MGFKFGKNYITNDVERDVVMLLKNIKYNKMHKVLFQYVKYLKMKRSRKFKFENSHIKIKIILSLNHKIRLLV